jgi:flagellar biosynthesis protein FlhG
MVVNRDADARLQLVINRAQTGAEGREAAEKISLVAERFLNLKIPTFGILPDDPNVTKSVKQQVPFILAHPDSIASKAIANMIDVQMNGKAEQDINKSGMKQFLNKMIRLFR